LALAPGTRLGPGGRGEVSKARDADRIVVIKDSSEKVSERFDRKRAPVTVNWPALVRKEAGAP
jgi:hypothetical protein